MDCIITLAAPKLLLKITLRIPTLPLQVYTTRDFDTLAIDPAVAVAQQ